MIPHRWLLLALPLLLLTLPASTLAHHDDPHEHQQSLLDAVRASDTQKTAELLDAGTSVDAATDRGREEGKTALMWAAEGGERAIVRQLLDAGHDETVPTLVELGAHEDTRDVYGWTPLMRAAERGDRDMVRTLLDLGADAEAKDKAGNSVVTIARQSGSEDVIDLLRRAQRG